MGLNNTYRVAGGLGFVNFVDANTLTGASNQLVDGKANTIGANTNGNQAVMISASQSYGGGTVISRAGRGDDGAYVTNILWARALSGPGVTSMGTGAVDIYGELRVDSVAGGTLVSYFPRATPMPATSTPTPSLSTPVAR